MAVNLTPPKGAQAACRRGLRLHEDGRSGDGLRPQTVREARKMAAGEAVSEDKVRRMRAWFARHASDRTEGWDTPGEETPGFVAWLLWGGDPGRAWAERKVAELDREAKGEGNMALETVDLKNVEIFATGTHNGQAYTRTDLDDMVAAFTALQGEYDPPVKLGHPEDQPALEDVAEGSGPAFGWVSSLRRVGDKLVADFARVPRRLAELIEAGAYRYRSAEIWWDLDLGEKVYRRVLKAVAFLGDTMPAVRTLKDIFKLYRTQGQQAFAHDREGHTYQPVLFAKEDTETLSLEDLEEALNDLAARMERDIKFKNGAPRVRQLLTDLKERARRYLKPRQQPDHPDDMPPKSMPAMSAEHQYSLPLLKTEVGYAMGGGTTGKACADCRWFNHWMEGGSCALVEGRIMAEDVCGRFEPMPRGMGHMGMYHAAGRADHAEALEGTWDGNAAVQRLRTWASKDGSGDKDTIDWAKYSRAFAVEGEVGTFEGYAFPHHDVQDGQLMLHRQGVIAAYSAARGGRSGQINTEAQRHLDPHRRMLGMMDDKEGNMADKHDTPQAVSVQEFEDLKTKLAAAEAKAQEFAATNTALTGKVDSLAAELQAANKRQVERWASDTVTSWYGDAESNRARLLKYVDAFGQDSQEVREYIDRENGHMTRLKEAGLFSERGHSGEPDPSPANEFDAEVKKFTDAGKTRAEAIGLVAREKPHLYKQYGEKVMGARITY